MEKLQNRRTFLKKVGVVAGLSQLPVSGWLTGFSNLFAEGIHPAGDFSLLKLEQLLSGYQYPFIDQFSTTSFKTEYSLYNLYGNNSVFAGEFFLQSETKGKSRRFDFSIGRLANAGIKKRDQEFKYLVSGRVQCKNNSFFSPENWDISSRIIQAGNETAFRGTWIKNKGEAKNGIINISTHGKPIEKSLGSMPLSWKWGLPAVVQNMTESSLEKLRFSVLDEFDAIHRNQTLKHKKRVPLDCGEGHMIDFHVFELTGDGVIPTVYWVDNLNRTVFVISGMEAFVLKK